MPFTAVSPCAMYLSDRLLPDRSLFAKSPTTDQFHWLPPSFGIAFIQTPEYCASASPPSVRTLTSCTLPSFMQKVTAWPPADPRRSDMPSIALLVSAMRLPWSERLRDAGP